MIIWIDGVFGVGKSSVANVLVQIIGEAISCHLDSDEIYITGMKADHRYFPGGFFPQNNLRFLADYKKAIEDAASEQYRVIIATMAITMDECRDYLFLPVSSEYQVQHVVLNAEQQVIKKRIENDNGRDKQFALSRLTSGQTYLENNFPDAVWIDTTNLSTSDVADQIMDLIRNLIS